MSASLGARQVASSPGRIETEARADLCGPDRLDALEARFAATVARVAHHLGALDAAPVVSPPALAAAG